MSNSVISICSKGHSDVWKLTSQLLPKNVDAESYIVYVPSDEIDYFKGITNPQIEIRAQETLGEKFSTSLEAAVIASKNEKRFGWYLQQFYKIQAIQLATTDMVTIWDADCVPISKIETVNDRDQVVYVNSSKEFHEPYFENINRLIGLNRVQKFSFVIPGFPIKTSWVSDLVKFIEIKHKMPWYSAIINNTDFTLQSGFSETETLGTWVANSYPGQWCSREGTWERFGQSRFGFARSMNVPKLVKLGQDNNLEIITFENWDVRGVKRLLKKIKSILSTP